MSLCKKVKGILIIAMLHLVILPANAGLESITKKLTPKDSMINITKEQVVNEQAAMHFLGGSVSVSAPPLDNLQLLNVEAPSFRCDGGICNQSMDIHAGGLSGIKADAFVKFLHQLPKQAKGYGVILALQTVCPQCEDITTWLQEAAQVINMTEIQACPILESIAGGMRSAANAGSELFKRRSLHEAQKKDDQVAISEKSRKMQVDEARPLSPDMKSVLGDNWNLVWMALDEKANISADNEFKEFLMSLSGTIIARKVDGVPTFTHKRSLYLTEKALAQFIGIDESVTKIETYQCDENTKCLKPTKVKKGIDRSKTYKAKIHELLVSIVGKIGMDGKALTSDEKALVDLASSELLIKIAVDFKEFGGNRKAVEQAQSQELDVLCYDVITKYLAQIVDEIRSAVSEMQYAQITDIGAFREFKEQVVEIERALMQARHNAYDRHALIADRSDRLRQRVGYSRTTTIKRLK